MSQALIITGMHRSGTSFVAELCQSAGLPIGERLFPGDAGNPRGYFEDEDILTLQRTMLAKACPPGVAGWPDWGWTEAEALDEGAWAGDEAAMRALARQRAHLPVWGWKDPRTCLLLEPWLRVLPDARFLFVVREPWKVASSVRRLPADLFRDRPDVGVRVWRYYNGRLMDFATKHPDRCVFVPMPWLTHAPHTVLSRAFARLGIEGLHADADRMREIVEGRQRDARPADPDQEDAFRRTYPEAVLLWEQLLAMAADT